jgi:hypothetical protein
MHDLIDLVYRSTSLSLSVFEKVESDSLELLQDSGSTIAVKNLQLIRLQKIFLAIGMFSYFESYLQGLLPRGGGFNEAINILKKKNLYEIEERFSNYIKAINVLKHGRGSSYDYLVSRSHKLPFRIKIENDSFFFEGDVSEVITLIDVDDNFILDCAKVIEDVYEVLR